MKVNEIRKPRVCVSVTRSVCGEFRSNLVKKEACGGFVNYRLGVYGEFRSAFIRLVGLW